MEFTCVLPDPEGTIIRFYRNSFLGSVSIKANGQLVYSLSALNPSTHFGTALTREYEFSLPGLRHGTCVLQKRGPLSLPGSAPIATTWRLTGRISEVTLVKYHRAVHEGGRRTDTF
jgi:hypothetical protein